jgi:glycosyltransferase involved in cell wall biosynthesis
MFFLSSTREGLPKILFVAMACGRPAVSTDPAGTVELFGHGNRGMLACVGDPASQGTRMTDFRLSAAACFPACPAASIRRPD